MTDKMDGTPPICICDTVQAIVAETVAKVTPVISDSALSSLPLERRSFITCLVTNAVRGLVEADFEMLPSLRTVISCGAGRDRYDMADLAARGITLHDTAEVVASDTAEMGVALVLALARGLLAGDAFVRSGLWKSQRAMPSKRVAGSTVGIVGLGRIGMLMAERLSALGCHIAYTARSKRAGLTWSYYDDVEALATVADFLVLCCPGGEETRRLINKNVFDALGQKGYLINISRGSVVDEGALIEALGSGKIAGAALDVFENEPTPDPRILALLNVIVSPHAAAVTDRYLVDLAQAVLTRVMEELNRF